MESCCCCSCKKTWTRTVNCEGVKFCTPDMDNPGIWFGDIGEWLWFSGQEFCSLPCMITFIENWHSRNKP